MRARSRGVGLAGAAVAVGAVVLALVVPAGPAGAAGSTYRRTNLVSDVPGRAQVTDPNLVNAWGLTYGPGTPVWVADNGTGKSTLYAGGVHGSAETVTPLVVAIPGGAPTGTVFNPTSGFVVHNGAASGPATFLFVSESGHLTGWSASSSGASAKDAVVRQGAVWKGLALGRPAAGPRLYAANFSAGRVDVFDSAFHPVATAGMFRDPNLPAHYAPFDVMVTGSRLYVSYAKRAGGGPDEVDGAGLGRVDVYTLGGRLLHRIRHHGKLDAPWGMTIAPAGFGRFSGDLLVGNFGDGRIHAFGAHTLARRGTVRNGAGHPIRIDGLWALLPGNGTEGGKDQVLFSAGPNDESHGLLGVLSLR
jgi:uncharacterized protein (TIGR03118 family)